MSNNNFQRNRFKPSADYTPNFDSGVLAEPLLAFGGGHKHVDPKIGLGLYGPYTLTGQSRPELASIIVGIVGPGSMIADAEQWLKACQTILKNDGSQPFLYPHFPGFSNNHPFQCELIFGDTWREIIAEGDLQTALSPENFYERVKSVVKLYISAIEVLSQRDPHPNVIICCIPQSVIDYCTVRTTRAGEIKRRKKSKVERKAEKDVLSGQRLLFQEMDPTLGIEGEEDAHQNLRRGLKAEAMQFGIPTQLVWPRTLRLSDLPVKPNEPAAEDIATRAWNFTTALYHKSGGSPWRLAEIDSRICFIGISFYREITAPNPRMRTSMAQAFTASGDGYVLRGNSFEWDKSEHEKSPHLDQKSAAALMRSVLELYQNQNRGSLPNRVVIYKSSRYREDELAGLTDACKCVPQKDFVALGNRKIQFYRLGDYPPIRGSYVKFSEKDLLLYTVGYVPLLRTYPGARVPQPLEILEHYGDTPWTVILQEILALTKLNWNTTYFACSMPITLAFSHKVGLILAELPPELPLRSEYRFYM